MKRTDLGILLAILGATFLIFSNLFSVTFLYDDYDFLFTWKQIQDFSHIPLLLLGNVPLHHEGIYRPLRSIFYVLSYHFYRHTIIFYHLQELVVYGACIVLIYFITQRLVKNHIISAATTVIFAIHPMHVDNVANLTGNFDTIGIVCLLLAFYSFQIFVDTKHSRYFVFSIIFSVLAFFTYEITLVLPFLILVYLYYTNQKRSWHYCLAYICVLALYLLVRIFLLHIDTRGDIVSNLPEKFIVTIENMYAYLLTTFLPLPISPPSLSSATGLLAFSEAPEVLPSVSQQVSSLTFIFPLLSLLLLLFIILRNFLKRSFFAFCFMWFFVSLLPIIAIGLQYSQTQLFWNRYAFIASYGICLLLGKLLYNILKSVPKTSLGLYLKSVAIAIFIVLFIYYTAMTYYNISQWRDQRPMLLEQIMKNKNGAQKYNDLGVIAASYQKYAEAIKDFHKSLQLAPHNVRTEKNLTTICHIIHSIPKATHIKCL